MFDTYESENEKDESKIWKRIMLKKRRKGFVSLFCFGPGKRVKIMNYE